MPLFFGHYWLTGNPAQLSEKAAWVDYSIAKGGKLVADDPVCRGRFDVGCVRSTRATAALARLNSRGEGPRGTMAFINCLPSQRFPIPHAIHPYR